MNKHLFASAAVLLLSTIAFSQNIAWHRVTGGFIDFGLVADSFDHVRMLNSFSGTHDFDPGPGESLIAVQGPRRFVLQSYRNDGAFRWARLHGGPNIDSTTASLAIDASGNSYIKGHFSQTADFDPGPGEYLLTTSGTSDHYLAKYDTLGALVWVKQLGGALRHDGEVNAPHLDRDGNILLAFSLTGTTDIDPGPGVTNLSPAGNWDALVLKLDPDFNLLWSAKVGGTSFDQAVSVRTDAQNNVYLLGSLAGAGDYDPGPDTFTLTKGSGTDDAFILKLDAAGNFIWARQLRCTQQNGKVYPIGLAVDAAGNSYTTGYYLIKADLDPGPAVLLKTAVGTNDIFVVKLDPDGNLVYGHSLGSSSLDTGTGIAADNEGSAYVTGYFTKPIDVDPSPDTVLSAPIFGSYDGFVLKYDATGKYQWVRRFGGPDNDTGYELALDNHQNLYYINRMTEVYNLGFAPGEDFVVPTALERTMLMRIEQENNYRGFVFRDLNSNQLRDPGEPGLPEVVIEVPEKNLFATTLEGGHYRLYYDLNADTVRPLALQPYWTITPAFAVSDTLNPVMNFAVTFPPDYRDISVRAFSLGTFRPGFTTDLEIHVTNWSSEPIDSIAVTLNDFALAPAFTFVEAVPAPDVLGANQALWYSDTLVPGETAVIAVRLKTPANIMLDTPIDLAVAAVYPNDVNPADDTAHIVSAVLGSYDPNDKLVFPTQVEIQDLDTSLLYYTIRFQNTGTAAAEFVILRDTLLAGLNPTTIQVLGASHPYTWRLHDANIFEVRFDAINLPDSTTNLEGSQGFVAFTLKPDRNLAVGDTVYNRAGIYFDYNAPIMTPWAKAAIVKQSVAVRELWSNRGALEVFPNPAQQQCTIRTMGKLSGPGEVLLLDMGGRIRLQKQVAEVRDPVTLPGLPAGGLYVVQVRTDKGFLSGLLVIQK